jgi:hypothetical protein
MNNNNLGGLMVSMHKKNILNVDRAVKIQRVGLNYKMTDIDMVGILEKNMSVVEHMSFYKDKGIKLPLIRKDADAFFLEVEYGTPGFYVMISVNEKEYNEYVSTFYDGYSK